MAFHFMNVPQIVRAPCDGHLGCFQFETIINKVAMNIQLQVFMYI